MAETGLSGEELDELAAEYVLGQLAGEERRAAEARLRADAAFRAAVADWERRLQPLADAAGDAQPPAGLFDRIAAEIGQAPAAAARGDNVVALHRSLRRWRLTSAIVGAAAAVLAGIVVFDRTQPVPQSEFVAVLTAEGQNPAFVATVDVANGTISLRQVASEVAPADKSYELWEIAPGAAPRSLGLVEQASLSRKLTDKASRDLIFAISLEPKGGSPTGAPTGPVVFKGSLVPMGE